MEQGFNFFEQNAQQQEELLSVDKVAVISEDFQSESGHDFSKTFIQAEFDEEWELKLLPNFENQGQTSIQDNIVNRQMYKRLPDLTRTGKRFRYIANPNPNDDDVMQLFFDLHKKKEAGDALAEALIAEFLSAPNEACVVAQVIGTPKGKEDKRGEVLLFPFSNGKNNAPIATIINNKLNPKNSREKKVNVFDMLLSPSLYLSCVKKMYDKKEGRDFSASSFSSTDVSPLIEVDGVLTHFTADDLNWSEKTVKKADGTEETMKYATGFKDAKFAEGFQKFLEKFKNPDISIHNHFAYKAPKDPRNSEETEKFIVENFDKMKKAVALIKNAKSVDEVLQAIGSDASATTNAEGETMDGTKAGDLLKSSTAGLLNNSTMNAQTTTTETKVDSTPTPSVDGIDFSAELNA